RLQFGLKPTHNSESKQTRRKRGKEANCAAIKGKEIDCHWKQSVLVCKTKDIELRTGSDHQANWKDYQAELNKELKRKLLKNSEKENKTLDELWDIIESSIKKLATNKLLQKKKTCVVEDISYTDTENKKLRKNIRTLGKWSSLVGNLSRRLKNRFHPIKEINSKWYEPLIGEVTEEEWGEALEQTKSKSAPGVSSITYPMIKKANGYAKEIF
ncbi:26985_t:CDS:2, partial [Gigaspora margarita]